MSLQVGTRGQEILESGKEVSRRERAGASRLGEARRLPKRVGGGSRGSVGGHRHPPHARGDRRPPAARDLRPSACVIPRARRRPHPARSGESRQTLSSPGSRPGPCGARLVLLVAPPRPRPPSRPPPGPSDRHRRRPKRRCAAHGEFAGHAPLGHHDSPSRRAAGLRDRRRLMARRPRFGTAADCAIRPLGMWWRGGGSAKRCRIPPALGILLWLAAAPSLAAPPAEPTLSRTTVPARGRQEAILTVPAFARYAVTVGSPQGTALQLVDRIAGPGQAQGTTGKTDWRLDVFLDRR